MADFRDKKDQAEKPQENDREELDNILDHLTESERQAGRSERPSDEGEEIIKKPTGSGDEPEDLEGMLEKLSETQPSANKKESFWQKVLNFFKRI